MWNTVVSDFGLQIFVALAVYLCGVGTSWIIHELFGGMLEAKMQKEVQLAVDIIYESENKFPGKGRGVEKLAYATKEFRRISGIKDYAKAQDYILKVFNLTKLS